MHGLLIAGFIALGGEHAPPDDEVLIRSRRRQRESGRKDRGRKRQHGAARETVVRGEECDREHGRGDGIGLPAGPQRERRARHRHQREAERDRRPGRRGRQKKAIGDRLEDIGVDLHSRHHLVVRRLQPVARALRRDADKDGLAGESPGERMVGEQLGEGNLGHAGTKIANPQNAVRRGNCHAADLDVILRFEDRLAHAGAVGFERQRPAPVVSGGLMEQDFAAHRVRLGVHMTDARGSFAKHRQGIFPAAARQKLAGKHDVRRVADRLREPLIVTWIAFVGQLHVDRDRFGRKRRDQLQTFRDSCAISANTANDAVGFLVDREQHRLRLPVRRPIHAENDVVGVLVDLAAERSPACDQRQNQRSRQPRRVFDRLPGPHASVVRHTDRALLPAMWQRCLALAVFVTGRVQSGNSDKETFHRETRTVSGVHLLLYEDSRMCSGRIRHAEILQGDATIGAPDDHHIRGQWLH